MPSLMLNANEAGLSDPGFDQKPILDLKAKGLFNGASTFIVSPFLEESANEKLFNEEFFSEEPSLNKAEQLLNTLLQKEKHTPESRFSQLATRYYESLTEELQKSPQLTFSYALHLGNQHRFDEALAEYMRLLPERAFAINARLQIINIYMLQGKTEQAAFHCSGLKKRNTPLLAAICSLWIRGVADSDAQASQLLSNIGDNLSPRDPLYFWVHDILLDVQLQLSQSDTAFMTLSKLKPLLGHDIAPVLQLVDYYLVRQEFAKAQSLLDEYDSDGQYWLRHAISSGLALGDLVVEQQKQIDFYQLRADPSKYFITSLWLKFNVKDHESAKLLALKNWQHYQKANDRLLLKLNDATDDINDEGEAL